MRLLLYLSIGAIALLAAALFAWSRLRPPDPIEGRILLRTQQCTPSDGTLAFEVAGFNRTDTVLADLTVRLSAGDAEALVTDIVPLEPLAIGDGFRLTADLPLPENLDVCIARFQARGQEIPSSFRP